MLKYKKSILKYSKYDFKLKTENGLINRINSFYTQRDKFHIYNLLSIENQNLQSKNATILLKNFFIYDFYANYFKLKGKSIINFPFFTDPKIDPFELNQNNSESTRNIFLKKLFNYLLEKNIIYKKVEKNITNNLSSNNSSSPLEKICYYLDLNNPKYLDLLEISNQECRLTKQPYKWPINFINEQEKILNKKSKIKIKFEFRDESMKGRHETNEIYVKVDYPEYIFGVTFMCIRSDSEYYEKLSLDDKKDKDNKTSFRLTSTYYAVNPINNEKIPILILDTKHEHAAEIENKVRVCVPGHNDIDYKLAKEFSMPVKYVIQPINKMASILSKNIKQPDDIDELIKLKSSSLEEIKNNLKSNTLDGPIILKDNEGFLSGCKEFDYLYLKEANELIVKNLISRKKAILEKRYEIKDPLIGYVDNSFNIIESDTHNLISFTPIYKLSASLFCLTVEKSKENFPVNIEILKKYFPIDLLIKINKNSKDLSLSNTSSNLDITKILFYSRIFYLHILDILCVNKRSDIWKSDIVENYDKVILDQSDISRDDLIYTEPFKEILEISDTDVNYSENIENFDFKKNLDDSIRFSYYLSLKDKIDYIDHHVSYRKYFENLSNNHETIIKLLKKHEFDIDNLRDEKLLLNKKSNKNLVIEINNMIIDILIHIETNKNKLNESAEKMINLMNVISESKNLLQEFPNYFVFLYLNYLILLFPFCPNLSNNLYQELRHHTNNCFNKENLFDFSITKLEETCKFFTEMISNTMSLGVLLDGEKIGNIILRKIDLDNKLLITEIIREKFNLGKEIANKINEFEIKDDLILITTIQ